jgi:hypothetical protein
MSYLCALCRLNLGVSRCISPGLDRLFITNTHHNTLIIICFHTDMFQIGYLITL